MREQVDAVWPGWGHASENPRLPNTLMTKGIKFIGPTGPVMYVLGDKIAANILAQTAKVPSIPWSGSFGGENDGPLEAKLNSEGTIPDEIFKKAQVFTVEEAITAANRIGYPVMLKASEGGGGKGIRMSANEEELRSNFVQVPKRVPMCWCRVLVFMCHKDTCTHRSNKLFVHRWLHFLSTRLEQERRVEDPVADVEVLDRWQTRFRGHPCS